MRFPTDMKLLWESVVWLHRHICQHCRDLGIRRPRNKYTDVSESYLSYCKKRKRKASRTRMLKHRMLRLLEKLIIQRDGIHRKYGASLRYTQDYQKRLSIIRKVLVQEKEMFAGRQVSDRIVSIARHYLRPIVRGKETKSVEFGAKVNNIQTDGISFIEHICCRFHIRQQRQQKVLHEIWDIHFLRAQGKGGKGRAVEKGAQK